jgi:hypothetical protein
MRLAAIFAMYSSADSRDSYSILTGVYFAAKLSKALLLSIESMNSSCGVAPPTLVGLIFFG